MPRVTTQLMLGLIGRPQIAAKETTSSDPPSRTFRPGELPCSLKKWTLHSIILFDYSPFATAAAATVTSATVPACSCLFFVFRFTFMHVYEASYTYTV